MDDTELGTQKFQDFQEAVYKGFQTLLIQSWGIPEYKISDGFPGIPVKIHKIWGKS